MCNTSNLEKKTCTWKKGFQVIFWYIYHFTTELHLSHWAGNLVLVCKQVSSILESIWLFVRIAMFKSYAEWLSWWVKILSCLGAFVWLGKPSECFVGLFRANISARPFQLYPNVFAKFSNPKFKFLMKFIKDSLCNSEIWLHFKKKLCLQFVRQTNTYSPEIPLRKPFNWLPASLFPWVSNLTECSTIPALKNIFFFGIENHGVLHTSLIERLRSIFLGIKAE